MSIGVVVIGRNEGARLRRCLDSLAKEPCPVVYVDSGSTDGSVALAKSLGAEVITLDPEIPFSAARARNTGYRRLAECVPNLRFVQFIDGDCALADDWVAAGLVALSSRRDIAIVAGWLNEMHPDASIFNRLGDLEWNAAGSGEVDAVGGIFMMRSEAFERVGGFDASMLSGEEPELCHRLIRAGYRILKLTAPMARHDLAMTHFTQWWTRQARNGYGSLDVASRFGLSAFKQISRRARVWTVWFLLTVLAGATSCFSSTGNWAIPAFLLLLSLWPAQFARIVLRTLRRGHPLRIAFAYGFYTMLAVWPQMAGQVRYLADRASRRSLRSIDYKSV
jgi:GT2 family glycosyltransferase